MTTEVRPRLLTSGDAARLIGVTTETITKASDAGRLTVYYLPGSRHRRFEADDILALKAGMKVRAPRHSWGHGVAPDKLAAARARAAHARACKAAMRQTR